jgi:uncharacterized DUF497 family protein
MHPSEADGFDWDGNNEGELETSQHPVKPWEAEEVFLNGPRWSRNKRQGSGEWRMVGVTDGGRTLTIILAFDRTTGMIRVITGWDSTPGERTKYLKR